MGVLPWIGRTSNLENQGRSEPRAFERAHLAHSGGSLIEFPTLGRRLLACAFTALDWARCC